MVWDRKQAGPAPVAAVRTLGWAADPGSVFCVFRQEASPWKMGNRASDEGKLPLSVKNSSPVVLLGTENTI